ncbi:helix-turn-helix transcriptional regulator [Staphylococcus hominis]|uniref:helix-turn-helix transcriptional regulator n=1 Tax=Staphylococcus hominis TaxID=1290 RepID=UPI0034CF76B7
MKMIAKSELLKSVIAFNGMSIKDFADELNLNNYFLNSIVNGKKTTSPKTAKKIVDYLGLDIKEVFEIKKNKEV